MFKSRGDVQQEARCKRGLSWTLDCLSRRMDQKSSLAFFFELSSSKRNDPEVIYSARAPGSGLKRGTTDPIRNPIFGRNTHAVETLDSVRGSPKSVR